MKNNVMVSKEVLAAYGLTEDAIMEPIVTGLINDTWKVTQGKETYVLQRINVSVFKNPYHVAENICRIEEYLKATAPDYLFVAPIRTMHREVYAIDEANNYYRLFPFVAGSHTFNVITHPQQALEAAAQFGKFSQLLNEFDARTLHYTIPDFHNLSLRYTQFQIALESGNTSRKKESEHFINTLAKYYDIVVRYEQMKNSEQIKLRVMHHDTKINNVLFDDKENAICIIDLDTIMPGYFISDLGDMMRTYLPSIGEEDENLSGMEVRDDVFSAILEGYLGAMRDQLTDEEKSLIVYSGFFMVYMQALRFLTDYLNNDIYYQPSHEKHNLMRAANQICLLDKLEEKKLLLQELTDRH